MDSLLNSGWCAYPFTKTSLAFAFHSNLCDFSLTTLLYQPQSSGKTFAYDYHEPSMLFSPLLTFSLTITLT